MAFNSGTTYKTSLGRAWCLLFICLILPEFITALTNITISVPRAVKRGGNAFLICDYDLERDNLYSIKWYKGRREFFRYEFDTNKSPNIKVFPLRLAETVDVKVSNRTHVLLTNLQPEDSAKYTCEISLDAPTFTTAMISGKLEVVELPEEQTVVTGIQSRYRIGDLVDGNCSIKFSRPAANLTWTINGIVVSPHHIKTYQIEKQENTSLESVMSALHFMVTTQHFMKGQMRLKCTASIFDIFKEEMESVIEEDRPRIMASGQSYDMHNYPYEQHRTSGDGIEEHNESFLTYYSAADTTSSATSLISSNILQKLKNGFHYFLLKLRTVTYELHKVSNGFGVQFPTSLTPTSMPRPSLSSSSSLIATILSIILEAPISRPTEQTTSERNSKNGGKFDAIAGIVSIVGSCYVAMTIILTHHFMSCQNTKTTKAIATVAYKKRSSTITSATKRPSAAPSMALTAAAVTTTKAPSSPSSSSSPSTLLAVSSACNNKSFYNCPESSEARQGEVRKFSSYKWQSDCQCDDNINDDCQREQHQHQHQQQQQQQEWQQKLHGLELQQTLPKEHAQVLWTHSADDTSTKSIEYLRDCSNAPSSNTVPSMSKDQILLMTVQTSLSQIPAIKIAFITRMTAVVANTFLQIFFQIIFQAQLHHNQYQFSLC